MSEPLFPRQHYGWLLLSYDLDAAFDALFLGAIPQPVEEPETYETWRIYRNKANGCCRTQTRLINWAKGT